LNGWLKEQVDWLLMGLTSFDTDWFSFETGLVVSAGFETLVYLIIGIKECDLVGETGSLDGL
jgi:hypothetical protein